MGLTNVLLAQGGGPTSVINGSLAAAIREYQKHKDDKIGRIYVAQHGADGILNENLVDVTDMSEAQLDGLEQTICAASGSARTKIDTKEKKQRALDVFEAHGINVVNLIGGGDTALTVADMNKAADDKGYNLITEHIMKTVDNDGYGLFSPGWGTIGMWQRDATLTFIKEIEAMPGAMLGVSMGRDSGWITAMTTHAFLAEGKDKRHMQRIYTPETGFSLDRLTDECCEAYKNSDRRLIINISEGVQEDGCDVSLHERLGLKEASDRTTLSNVLSNPDVTDAIIKTLKTSQEREKFKELAQGYAGAAAAGVQRDAHNNVSYGELRSVNLADWAADYVAAAVKERLNLKKFRVRGNTFGYMQRCSPTISSLDLYGAKLVGQEAARNAIGRIKSDGEGNSYVNKTYGASIVLFDAQDEGSRVITQNLKAKAVSLDNIADMEKKHGIQYQMPPEFMSPQGPTKAFLEYSRALVECDALRADPTKFVNFTDASVKKVDKKLEAYRPAA